MARGVIEVLAFFVVAACGVWWLAALIGPRPKRGRKATPQMTPWHPERGRKKANAQLVFYLFLYGPGWMLVLWATHTHLR
jgi:hypothetical protein